MRRLPFLLSLFSEIPEKPRRRIDSIPFLYSLGVSVGIKPLVHFGYCSGQIFSKHIRSGMQREKFAGLRIRKKFFYGDVHITKLFTHSTKKADRLLIGDASCGCVPVFYILQIFAPAAG